MKDISDRVGFEQKEEVVGDGVTGRLADKDKKKTL